MANEQMQLSAKEQKYLDMAIMLSLSIAHSEYFKDLYRNPTLEMCEIPQAVRNSAERKVKEILPDDTLDEVIKRWKLYPTNVNVSTSTEGDCEEIVPSAICGGFAYAPEKNIMINVLPPPSKRIVHKVEFDAFEFLRNRDGYHLRLPQDYELEADLEVLTEPRKESMIDASLRRIARAIAVLNDNCSYRILDINSERWVR